MATKNKVNITSDIVAEIKSGNSDTTAAGLRTILYEFLDSYVNVKDGGLVYEKPVGYDGLLTLTDAKSFVYKKWVEDYINKSIIDTAANFTANNPILGLGQLGIETDDLLTVPKFKIGDGANDWSTLPYFSSSSTPDLGLIQIVDKAGDFFTDLATATAYIEQFITPGVITDKSFNEGIFFFTVPAYTWVSGNFLTDNITPSVTYASLIDRFGLLNLINCDDLFYMNAGHHIIGDGYFMYSAFNFFTGSVEMNSLFITASGGNFAESSTGKFIIKGRIGINETAQFGVNFFLNSTATIFANASKYTSNAGGIHGDLQTAITNGCNVQFDGIDLEQTANKQNSLTVDGTGVKYPTVDAVNTKGSIQNYYSGKRVTIPFAGTSSAINGWNGAIIYIPIPITSSVAFTDISQEVTALAVGSNIRLALYTSVNGLPSALLEDSGNLSTATIGIKNYVLSAPHSFTAVDKQVFVAIQSSSAGIGLRYALNTVCFNYFNGSGQSGGLFYQVQAFGAFPATATPSVYANANSPLVSLLVQ